MLILAASGEIKSERGVCIVPLTSLPDDELRQSLVDLPNGEYGATICRGCGTYRVTPTGDYRTAKITFQCEACFEESS